MYEMLIFTQHSSVFSYVVSYCSSTRTCTCISLTLGRINNNEVYQEGTCTCILQLSYIQVWAIYFIPVFPTNDW